MTEVKVSTFEDPERQLDCPLDNFVEYLPTLMLIICTTRTFPSLAVINDLFSVGHMDAGMSGGLKWQPFEISEEQRRSLMDTVSRKYQIEYQRNETLESCITYADWSRKAVRFGRKKI